MWVQIPGDGFVSVSESCFISRSALFTARIMNACVHRRQSRRVGGRTLVRYCVCASGVDKKISSKGYRSTDGVAATEEWVLMAHLLTQFFVQVSICNFLKILVINGC